MPSSFNPPSGGGSSSASDLTSGTLPDGRFPSTLPAVSGASLTGITATQVGLGNVTNDAQVKVTDIGTAVLAPGGSGALLSGITPGQVGAATSAQGTTADTALQPGGNIALTSGINSDITTAIVNAIAALKNDAGTLAAIIASTGIAPVSVSVNGVTSISTSGGIVTGAA